MKRWHRRKLQRWTKRKKYARCEECRQRATIKLTSGDRFGNINFVKERWFAIKACKGCGLTTIKWADGGCEL